MTAIITADPSLSVVQLSGVGPRTADLLARLDIRFVQDLLFHLPTRYEDRTHITPLADVRVGEYQLIQAEIVKSYVQFGKRRSLICELSDGQATLLCRFFHFNRDQQQKLAQEGALLRCFGEVRQSYRGGLEMVHPEYRHVSTHTPLSLDQHLSPIYPTTKGLQQTMWRRLTSEALNLLDAGILMDYLTDHAPISKMMDLREALHYVHRPPPDAELTLLQSGRHPAQRRLACEELLAHQLSLWQLRQNVQQIRAVNCQMVTTQQQALQQRLRQALPFQLTTAQNRVIQDIQDDLGKTEPMLRLVQGDVGSGKTIVAAMAIVQVVAAGCQAAMMAPTEILAEQHHQALQNWLHPLGLKVACLLGSLSSKAKREIYQAASTGAVDVIVGTHALIQQAVNFAKLALVVIDEQHRFGVHQRLSLTEKAQDKTQPHQLIMTATPIPRTLAMTAYADLDVSIIDELPPGRQPITTVLLANDRRVAVMERLRAHCQRGQQAYWVCTLIEDSEVLQAQAAEVTYQSLTESLPDLKIALVHGRLNNQQKEQIMVAFKNGQIDLLVATTVIEVGVDVPNATLMIIDNPERLGLAQLHQLRGRVGRGSQASYCVLLYQKPLSLNARQRLTIMREHTDGFVIAEHDLKIRGPGEMLGTRQTGLMRFRIADIIRDQDLLDTVQVLSRELCQKQHSTVDALIKRWLGSSEQYAKV